MVTLIEFINHSGGYLILWTQGIGNPTNSYITYVSINLVNYIKLVNVNNLT